MATEARHPVEACECMRLALRHAAALGPAELLCRDDAPPSPRLRQTAGSRRAIGLHSHACAELCLTLSGDAALDVAGRRHAFSTGRMAVLEPHIIHAEGYARRTDAYTMLWLVGALPATVAIVSRYRPLSGWDCPVRLTVRSAHGPRLFEPFLLAGTAMTRAMLDPVRAEIIGLLADAHALAHRAIAPRDPSPPDEAARHAELLEQLRQWLDEHLDQPVRVADLAAMTRLSPNHVNHLFTAMHGEAIHAYLHRRRMQRAMELARGSDLLAKEIAQRTGFADPLYFSRAFRRFHGVSHQQARDARRNAVVSKIREQKSDSGAGAPGMDDMDY